MSSAAVDYEIELFKHPKLNNYEITEKIGEGTFSSVYKALTRVDPPLKRRKGQNNSPLQFDYVAIKRIYTTSSPLRILNELKILYELRGKLFFLSLEPTTTFQPDCLGKDEFFFLGRVFINYLLL